MSDHLVNVFLTLVVKYFILILLKYYYILVSREASRGAGTQSVTLKSTGCGGSNPFEEMKYLLKFKFSFNALVSMQVAALSFATQRNASRMRQKVGNGVF